MAIKLHTCGNTWIHGGHPCSKVMKALDDAGVPYEQVKEPSLRPMRKAMKERTGQVKLPVLELEDGTMVREESADLIRRIEAGDFAPAAP
jgi:glutathione S-transferase